jgi:hypothetical protein
VAVHLKHARIFILSNLIFTNTGSSRVRVGKVQAHQTRQFTSNMLKNLFKSNLIFTTMGSSGARVGEVQTHQTRQFTLNMLEFLFKLYLIFYHYGKFKSASGISSGAPNTAVQLEHATIFI